MLMEKVLKVWEMPILLELEAPEQPEVQEK